MALTIINCDTGEGFGIYRLGDDAALMPLITAANVACGFHASDFNHMRTTVRLAKSLAPTMTLGTCLKEPNSCQGRS